MDIADQTLTSDTFEQTVVDNGIVLVDFWAVVVRPVPPVRAGLRGRGRAQHEDVVFGKVDTEAEQSLAAAAQITSIPTLMAFRDGILVFASPAPSRPGARAGHHRGQGPRHGRRTPPDRRAAERQQPD